MLALDEPLAHLKRGVSSEQRDSHAMAGPWAPSSLGRLLRTWRSGVVHEPLCEPHLVPKCLLGQKSYRILDVIPPAHDLDDRIHAHPHHALLQASRAARHAARRGGPANLPRARPPAKRTGKVVTPGSPVAVAVVVKNSGATTVDGIDVRVTSSVVGGWKVRTAGKTAPTLEEDRVSWLKQELRKGKQRRYVLSGRVCAGATPGTQTLADVAVIRRNATGSVVCVTRASPLTVSPPSLCCLHVGVDDGPARWDGGDIFKRGEIVWNVLTLRPSNPASSIRPRSRTRGSPTPRPPPVRRSTARRSGAG